MSKPCITKKLASRIISAFVALSFLLTSTSVYAQALAPSMPMSGMPGALLVPGVQFNPVMLRAIEIDPVDPFHFGFIVDSGDTQMEGEELTEEAKKLIRYFLASLTTPEEDMWVNLSPYEADRIIPDSFGQTQMGRDLLAQDYILKQLTASLIYPEDELGQQFWQKIYQKAYEQYGTTEIPVDTFNKVWIMPKKASVYEHNNRVFVIDSELDVMMESDFLAMQENRSSSLIADSKTNEPRAKSQELASAILRDIIIPEIKKEVNAGQHFANLRQIYHAMILAAWYKNNLKESLLGQMYVDQNKVKGIEGQRIIGTKTDPSDPQILKSSDPESDVQIIYNQYLETFKQGVYNFIKVEHDQYSGKNLPRKYFSGGYTPEMSWSDGKTTLMGGGVDQATVADANRALSKPSGKLTRFDGNTRPVDEGSSNSATTSASAIKVSFPEDTDFNVSDFVLSLQESGLDKVRKIIVGDRIYERTSRGGFASYSVTYNPETGFYDFRYPWKNIVSYGLGFSEEIKNEKLTPAEVVSVVVVNRERESLEAWIDLRREGGMVEISVEDYGEPITGKMFSNRVKWYLKELSGGETSASAIKVDKALDILDKLVGANGLPTAARLLENIRYIAVRPAVYQNLISVDAENFNDVGSMVKTLREKIVTLQLENKPLDYFWISYQKPDSDIGSNIQTNGELYEVVDLQHSFNDQEQKDIHKALKAMKFKQGKIKSTSASAIKVAVSKLQQIMPEITKKLIQEIARLDPKTTPVVDFGDMIFNDKDGKLITVMESGRLLALQKGGELEKGIRAKLKREGEGKIDMDMPPATALTKVWDQWNQVDRPQRIEELEAQLEAKVAEELDATLARELKEIDKIATVKVNLSLNSHFYDSSLVFVINDDGHLSLAAEEKDVTPAHMQLKEIAQEVLNEVQGAFASAIPLDPAKRPSAELLSRIKEEILAKSQVYTEDNLQALGNITKLESLSSIGLVEDRISLLKKINVPIYEFSDERISNLIELSPKKEIVIDPNYDWLVDITFNDGVRLGIIVRRESTMPGRDPQPFSSASAIKVAFSGDLNIWDFAHALMDKVDGILTSDREGIYLKVGKAFDYKRSSRKLGDGELLTVDFSVDDDRYRVTLERAGDDIEIKGYDVHTIGFNGISSEMQTYASQVLEGMSQSFSTIKSIAGVGSAIPFDLNTRPADGAETNNAMISSTLTKTNLFKTVELFDILAQQEGWDVSSIEPFVVDKSVDKTFDEVFDSHDAFHSSELMEIVDEENLISELNGVFITFKNSNGSEERARVHFYQRVNGQFTVSVTPHQSIKKQLDIVALREFSSPTDLSYVLRQAESQQPVLIDLAQAVSSGISMNRQQLNAVMQRIVRDENLDVLRVGFKTSDGTYDTFSPSNRRAPWLDLSLHAHYTYVTIVLADNSVYHFNADKRSGGRVAHTKNSRPFVESVASKVALKIKPGILSKGTIIDYEKMLNDMMEANGWRRNIEIKPRTSRILSVQHLQSLLRHSAVFMMMDSGRVVDAEAVQQWINTGVSPVVYRFSFSDDSVLYLLEEGEVAPVRASAQPPISGSDFLRPQARDPQRTKPQTGKVAEQKKETSQEVLRLNDYEFRVYPNRVELWDAEGLNELSRMSIPQLSEQDNEEKQKFLNSFLTRYLEKKTGLSQDPETLTVSRSTPLDLYEIIKNLRSQTDKRVTLVKVSRSRSQQMQSYRPNNFSDLKGTLVQNMSFVRISFSDRTSIEINITEKKDFRELRIRGNELIQEENKWSSDTITAKALKRAARDVINAMRSVFSEQSKQTVKDVLSVEPDRPVVQAQSQESAPSMFDRDKKPKTEQRGFLPEDSKKVQRDIQELVSVVDSPQALKTIEIFGFDKQHRGYNALAGAQIKDSIDAFRERFGDVIKTMSFLIEKFNIIVRFEKNTGKVIEVLVFDKIFRQYEKADLQRLQLSAENFLSTAPEEKKAEAQSEASKPAQDIPFNPNITERKESISFKGGVFDIKKFADEVVRKADGTLTINPRSSNGATVFVFTSRNKLNYRDIHKPLVVSYVVTLKEVGEGVEVKAEFQSLGADMNHDEGLLRLAADILKSMSQEAGVVEAPLVMSELARKTQPAKLNELSPEQFGDQLFAFISQLDFGIYDAINIFDGEKFYSFYDKFDVRENIANELTSLVLNKKFDNQSIEILWPEDGVRINLKNGEVRNVLNKHPIRKPDGDEKIDQARQNLPTRHFLSTARSEISKEIVKSGPSADKRNIMDLSETEIEDHLLSFLGALNQSKPKERKLHFKTGFNRVAGQFFYAKSNIRTPERINFSITAELNNGEEIIFKVKEGKILSVWSGLYNRDASREEIDKARSMLSSDNFLFHANESAAEQEDMMVAQQDVQGVLPREPEKFVEDVLEFMNEIGAGMPTNFVLYNSFVTKAQSVFSRVEQLAEKLRLNTSYTTAGFPKLEINFVEDKLTIEFNHDRTIKKIFFTDSLGIDDVEFVNDVRARLSKDNFLSTASSTLGGIQSSSGLKKVEEHVVGYRPDPNDKAKDRIATPQAPGLPQGHRVALENPSWDFENGEPVDENYKNPGGIIMGTSSVELDIRRDGNGIPLPLLEQPVELMNVPGFTFDIIGVTVVPNLLLLSGLRESDADKSFSQRMGEIMGEPMVADKRRGNINI